MDGFIQRLQCLLTKANLRSATRSAEGPYSPFGSRFAIGAADHRKQLAARGLAGVMSRCGNPYDNAKAKSFMKTLKAEAECLRDYETFEDTTPIFPASSNEVYIHRRLLQLGSLRAARREAGRD